MSIVETTLFKHQVELETLYNKNQLIPRIRQEFIDAEVFELKFAQIGVPQKFGFDLLTQMALHKRCSLPTMVGILRHHMDTAQEVADMLLICAKADLVDWHDATKQFVVRYEITKDVQEELDRYQFPLPMVIPPREVRHNGETGYLMTGGSIILKKNHHEDDVCLDHINRVNLIKFTIDTDTATMIKNKWRNLDKVKEGETRADLIKRQKAFEKYDRTAKDVIGKIVQHGNEFYLTHRYDKRGRVYCQGYHINYQGTPWNKAVVQLADKEPLND